MIRKINFIGAFIIVLSGISCNTSKQSTQTIKSVNELSGTYIGTIPCADCEGIIYELQLKSDNTYNNSLIYKGKSDTPIKKSGTYTFNKQIIQLDSNAGSMNMLQKTAEGLLLLDKNGKVIEGSLANNYKLTPIATSTVSTNSENSGMQKILMQKQQEGIDFYAIGNEPSWSLDMDFDKIIRFKTANGITFNAPAVEPELAQDHNVKRFRAVTESGEIIIQIIQGDCKDTMADRSYPYQVTVDFKTSTASDFTSLKGCGMYIPDFRLHDIWAIESVEGIILNASDYKKNAPKLEIFVSEQRVLGSDGCNTFRGKMYNEENRLYFGPMASTRMACLNNTEISYKINSVFSKNAITYSIENNRLTIFNNNKEAMVLKHID